LSQSQREDASESSDSDSDSGSGSGSSSSDSEESKNLLPTANITTKRGGAASATVANSSANYEKKPPRVKTNQAPPTKPANTKPAPVPANKKGGKGGKNPAVTQVTPATPAVPLIDLIAKANDSTAVVVDLTTTNSQEEVEATPAKGGTVKKAPAAKRNAATAAKTDKNVTATATSAASKRPRKQ
jgi:hypothetical protein